MTPVMKRRRRNRGKMKRFVKAYVAYCKDNRHRLITEAEAMIIVRLYAFSIFQNLKRVKDGRLGGRYS